MPLELGPGVPVYLARKEGRLRAQGHVPGVPPRRRGELVLAEARGVVRGAGLAQVGVEEVRRGGAMVRLSHHVGFGGGELGPGVGAKQRGVQLRLACGGREDGEVGLGKGGGDEVRLLLLLGLGRVGSRGRGAKGGGFSLDVGKGLGQVERGDGGGVGLGEGLWCGLLVAQEAGGVGVVSREVGLGHGELLDCRVDEADSETDR